jgi:hypothetical protein
MLLVKILMVSVITVWFYCGLKAWQQVLGERTPDSFDFAMLFMAAILGPLALFINELNGLY